MRGLKGDKGDKGDSDKGDKGDKGERGNTGEQSLKARDTVEHNRKIVSAYQKIIDSQSMI